MEEVQAALRTNELIKFKDLKLDDSGEGLNVTRGRCGSRGNWVNTQHGDKVLKKSRSPRRGGGKNTRLSLKRIFY